LEHDSKAIAKTMVIKLNFIIGNLVNTDLFAWEMVSSQSGELSE
jgi:hypothetical protein